MAKRFCVLGLIVAVTPSVAVAYDWMTYVNDRFGATADIPASYKAGEAPANGDGLHFTSPEGDATIAVWGALAKVMEESFAGYAKRLIDYATNEGWTASYSAGKKAGTHFPAAKRIVEKVVEACKGEIANLCAWSIRRCTRPSSMPSLTT